MKTKKIAVIIEKLNNVYEQFKAHKILKKEIYHKEFVQILRNAGGENQRGLGQYYHTLLRRHKIVIKQRNGYEWNSEYSELQEIAPKLWQENYDNSIGFNVKKKQRKQHDIVQPTLFTESVMREQQRPIVTANDQLIQRLEALEAQHNKIIAFFKTI